MTKREARKILTQHNAYRRGLAVGCRWDAIKIGQAIDVAIRVMARKK
jgi:hypothetical protein